MATFAVALVTFGIVFAVRSYQKDAGLWVTSLAPSTSHSEPFTWIVQNNSSGIRALVIYNPNNLRPIHLTCVRQRFYGGMRLHMNGEAVKLRPDAVNVLVAIESSAIQQKWIPNLEFSRIVGTDIPELHAVMLLLGEIKGARRD